MAGNGPSRNSPGWVATPPGTLSRKASLNRLQFVLAFLAIVVTAHAHRLDEYLQATLVDIERHQVTLELNLTPGVSCANAVLWLIDLNHDGEISSTEAKAYANSVLSNLTLRLDDHPLSLRLTDSRFPPIADLRNGVGVIQLKLNATIASLPPGNHELHFQNRHRPTLSAYLVNALLPQSPEIHITRQDRDIIQSESRIQFSYTPSIVNQQLTSWRLFHGLGLVCLLGCSVLIVSSAALFWRKRRTSNARLKETEVSPLKA